MGHHLVPHGHFRVRTLTPCARIQEEAAPSPPEVPVTPESSGGSRREDVFHGVFQRKGARNGGLTHGKMVKIWCLKQKNLVNG